jgi:hypothetical protein
VKPTKQEISQTICQGDPEASVVMLQHGTEQYIAGTRWIFELIHGPLSP